MKKIIIISGISKGLGLGLAKKLLAEGWKIAGFSRKKNNKTRILEKKFKNNFLFHALDINDHNNFDKFLSIVKKKGKIYGLINNAGIVNEDFLADYSAAKSTSNQKWHPSQIDVDFRMAMCEFEGCAVSLIMSWVKFSSFSGLKVH